MRVFWSWQNDLAPSRHRHFIKECLEEAVNNVGRDLGVDERPELDHDTKDTPGMAEIATTILRKIADSAVFVADLTPICRSENGKALLNPNILIELGWAINKPGFDKIIGVFNAAEGWKPDDMPFDIRHRRAMQYKLPEGADAKMKAAAKEKLTEELTEAIRVNLREHADQRDAAVEISGRAASADDPSVWLGGNGPLTYQDGQRSKQISLLEKPRSYFRIIPLGWPHGAPSVRSILDLPDNKKLWAPSGSGPHGDYGPTEDGYVSFWFRSLQEAQTENLLYYFDETGEIWIVQGSVVSEGPNQGLGWQSMLREWASRLRSTLAFFDHFRALPLRRVEVGVVKIKGVYWPGSDQTARKGKFTLARQDRDWGEQAQLEFLTRAFNGVAELFTLAPITNEQLRKLIG